MVGYVARKRICYKEVEYMTDTYRGGYKKCLLDLHNLFRTINSELKPITLKKYKIAIRSVLMLLMQNPDQLDRFMETGGMLLDGWVWNTKTGEMTFKKKHDNNISDLTNEKDRAIISRN